MLQIARVQVILVAMFGLLAVAGCKHAAEASNVSVSGSSDPLEIRTTPALLDHIRVGEAKWQQVTSSEKVAASVLPLRAALPESWSLRGNM